MRFAQLIESTRRLMEQYGNENLSLSEGGLTYKIEKKGSFKFIKVLDEFGRQILEVTKVQ